MIGNAIVDVWIAEGVRSILKYEDDLAIFRHPIPDGRGLHKYAYDRKDVSPDYCPLAPRQPTPLTFIGRISKPVRSPVLFMTHGSLCYISFVYTDGRSRLPGLTSPISHRSLHKGDEYICLFPPPSDLNAIGTRSMDGQARLGGQGGGLWQVRVDHELGRLRVR